MPQLYPGLGTRDVLKEKKLIVSALMEFMVQWRDDGCKSSPKLVTRDRRTREVGVGQWGQWSQAAEV